MIYKLRRIYEIAASVSLCLLGTASTLRADIVVDASVGGAPTGVSYANFDNLPLGAVGGVSGGITVSFSGTGQAVQGALPKQYAAPYLSNDNGVLFGDPNNGPDTTTYLSTGTGSVTLILPALEKYVGLLWGSVDNYNTLSFYNGANLVGSITGADVAANANGNQGVSGTYYANITSTDSFDRIVATSSSNAFEFDNVAFNPTAVPEPSSIIIALLGGIGVLGHQYKRRSGLSVGRDV